MREKNNNSAREILVKIKYATLATVTPEGGAWNSPVAHYLDAARNVYWLSDKDNQHSRNIRNNECVFIVIYDSTAPLGTGQGVYIDATAYEVATAQEVEEIKEKLDIDDPDELLGNSIRRCYKAIPRKMWINDAEIKDDIVTRDYRVEINLT